MLVADEAVSALDVSVQAQVLELLDEIQTRLGIALLFITHDLRVAAQICDDVAVMQNGRIVEQGPAAQVLTNPQVAYTRALLDAAPGRGWDFANFRPVARAFGADAALQSPSLRAQRSNPWNAAASEDWIASSLALLAMTSLTSVRGLLVETDLMTRIAVGGFLHETNTFAPTKATYDDFVHGGGWPAMALGADVLKTMRDINVGLAGFVGQAEAHGWELVPTIACAASPSAHVTEDAFERIVKVMVDGIAAAGRLDAVYLDLHGAMVTEHLDDGEGEILARVRKVIGNELPLVVSLDLHANVTPQMVEHADALIAYRTYPHVDMADTGRAAAKHLALLLRTRQPLAKAFRQLPFLIPISWQCTNDQPARGIYRKLAALQSEAVPTLSFAPGFPAADFPDCGPSVFAYGRTQADADAAADAMARLVIGHEDDFDGRIYSPDEGVRHAMELATRARKPIVIADTQDNPGAGGDSDTTGMLRALVRNNARRAAIGVIYDPHRPGPRMPPAPAPPSRLRSAASRAYRAMRRTRRASSSRNCPTENSSRPAPITAAATWTWDRRRRCGSAMSAWS